MLSSLITILDYLVIQKIKDKQINDRNILNHLQEKLNQEKEQLKYYKENAKLIKSYINEEKLIDSSSDLLEIEKEIRNWVDLLSEKQKGYTYSKKRK